MTHQSNHQNQNKQQLDALLTKQIEQQDQAKAETTAVPSASSSATKSSGPGWWLWTVSLVIALLAAAGSGYLWQQYQTHQLQLQKTQADIAGAIQRVDQQSGDSQTLQRQLDRQVDGAVQQQQKLQQQIDQLRGQLSSQQKRLLSLSTTDRDDWLLAEAEYLLRLANQRLLMGKEVKGALALLRATDDIMKELDDSALFPVRKALAEDMEALRLAGKLDIEGLYLQLGAVATQAQQLQLIKLPELQIAPVEAQQPENWQQRLEVGLSAAWAKLNQYIQINRRDEVYQPLLAPEYEAAVRQNVRAMIEQAQLAALAGKQRVYEDSLAKAAHWLTLYYSLDKEASGVIVTRIEELAQQQIAVTLPDISGSLRSLKNYLEMIHQIAPLAAAQTVEDKKPAFKAEPATAPEEKAAGEAAQ